VRFELPLLVSTLKKYERASPTEQQRAKDNKGRIKPAPRTKAVHRQAEPQHGRQRGGYADDWYSRVMTSQRFQGADNCA
jgi:hypothetical protein